MQKRLAQFLWSIVLRSQEKSYPVVFISCFIIVWEAFWGPVEEKKKKKYFNGKSFLGSLPIQFQSINATLAYSLSERLFLSFEFFPISKVEEIVLETKKTFDAGYKIKEER